MSTTATTPARKVLTVVRTGVVTSDKRDKTLTVKVNYQKSHTKYGKILRRQTKFQVHDPDNQAHVGDKVEIAQCRPISKTKNWRLVRVLEKAIA